MDFKNLLRFFPHIIIGIYILVMVILLIVLNDYEKKAIIYSGAKAHSYHKKATSIKWTMLWTTIGGGIAIGSTLYFKPHLKLSNSMPGGSPSIPVRSGMSSQIPVPTPSEGAYSAPRNIMGGVAQSSPYGGAQGNPYGASHGMMGGATHSSVHGVSPVSSPYGASAPNTYGVQMGGAPSYSAQPQMTSPYGGQAATSPYGASNPYL